MSKTQATTATHPRETVVGVDPGLSTLLAATGPDASDPLTIDGGPTWDLFAECAERNGADADTYRSIMDARIDQATDRLAAYLDTHGASTVAVESYGQPDRTLSELARDGANADAWVIPRLRASIHDLAGRGYRVVDVFAGGTSQTCHACQTTGERHGPTFVCSNAECSVDECDADVNSAGVIATRAREGRQIVGEIDG